MQPSNTIVGRVAEFLSAYPPFEHLPASEIAKVAAAVSIGYFDEGKILFSIGDPPGSHFYMVREGCVTLRDGQGQLIDQCDEGDIFGVRSMLTGNNYILEARVHEAALLYKIPNAIFKPFIESNAKVALYFASGLASGQIPNTTVNPEFFPKKAESQHQENIFNLNEKVLADPSKQVIVCNKGNTIQQAAQMMAKNKVGSIVIVDERKHPLGIVTDTDLRRFVATGEIPIEENIDKIMSSPVIAIADATPVYEVVLKMMDKGVHHLCITENGSDNSPVLGIVSERDLLIIHSDDPAVLLKQLKNARDTTGLAELRNKAELLIQRYLQHEVAIPYITKVATKINDAMIIQAVKFAIEALAKKGRKQPKSTFVWFSLGSEGREEQLLRTDQDNALLYEVAPDETEQDVKAYFLQMAQLVIQTLEACGFEKCPAEMMASNPKWCASLATWGSYFSDWILTPDQKSIMLSTIFFDYRPIVGSEELKVKLDARLKALIGKKKIFLNYLAKNATQNPAPLSFFKNFLVEKSGEHKDQFDIKLRAMMPLVDAARVLALDFGLFEAKNTVERFHAIALKDAGNANLYHDAAKAYEIFLRNRAITGLKHQNSGRYVPLQELAKIDRLQLRNAFEPIRELQNMLEVRYQLSFFNT